MSVFTTVNISESQTRLNNHGHIMMHFPHLEQIENDILNKNYLAIDSYFQEMTAPNGELFKTLGMFTTVKKIEFIISLREAHNDWEEDGIWHDDGSRIMAFSLSLTKEKPIGGQLGFRKKGEQKTYMIPTPDFGNMIIFKTGIEGYEHKIHAVTKGARLVIAGWCYSEK